MTRKSIAISPDTVRYPDVDALPRPPAVAADAKAWTDEEIAARATADEDAGPIPGGFWDDARVVEPEGTEQITLRLPRRVLRHFRAGGKGYHGRISAVLSSYVDAKTRR